ncbi:MAG TPA: hypothetical protein VGD69_27805 [Herpetosiphonaceae bacterium]
MNLKQTLFAHSILFVILVGICLYADVPLYGAVLLSLVGMIINGVQRIFPFWD